MSNSKSNRLAFLPSLETSTSYWIAEADQKLSKHRTTETLPSTADVVIIGSGYSGSSVAFNLLVEEQCKGSVLLLEARDTCSGATGRNGGHFRSFYNLKSHYYESTYGAEVAADLASFEHYEMGRILKIAEKYGINCHISITESCQTYDHSSMLKKGLKDYYAFVNNPYIPKDVKDVVKIYWDEQAKEISDLDDTAMAVIVPTCSLWPYKLITQLLEKAIENGLNLQTNTPVTKINHLPNGKVLISTERGEVLANKVVIATNGYTKAILPEFSNKILLVKGVVSHLKQADPETTGTLKYNYYHSNSDFSDYVSVRHDGTIIAGGAHSTYVEYPLSVMMYNNPDDSKFPKVSGDYFKDYVNKHYVSLKGKKFDNDYTWTGCMGDTNDEFPIVGDLTSYGRPNTFIVAGFSGHGMPRIWSCGKYIADLVLNKAKDDLTHIPEPFKISKERMYNSEFDTVDRLIQADERNRLEFKL